MIDCDPAGGNVPEGVDYPSVRSVQWYVQMVGMAETSVTRDKYVSSHRKEAAPDAVRKPG